MAALDLVGAALVAGCLYLVALVVRRRLLSRHGGTVEMALRLRHWTFGVARYEPDRLLWFRTFSLSPRPRRDLARRELRVVSRRAPHGHESVGLLHGALVVECDCGGEPVELAVHASAALGLLAWLEAAPATLRDRARGAR